MSLPKLRPYLPPAGTDCLTVREAGFEGFSNGALLAAAESPFDILVTIDKNLPRQQNLTERKIAVLIMRVRSSDISDVAPVVPLALNALKTIEPGKLEV